MIEMGRLMGCGTNFTVGDDALIVPQQAEEIREIRCGVVRCCVSTLRYAKFGGASCGHPGRGDPTAFMEQYSFPHWFYGILQVHSVGRVTRPLR